MRAPAFITRHRRILAIAAVPTAVLIAGTLYLVNLATGESVEAEFRSPSTSVAPTPWPESTAEASAPDSPTSTHSQGGPIPPTSTTRRQTPADEGADQDPGDAQEDPDEPPPPDVRIDVSGARLDASTPRSDSCTDFSNTQFRLPVEVRSVDLITDTPGRLLLDSNACRGVSNSGRRCENATLRPGAGCYTGVRLKSDAPPGLYTGVITLLLAAKCTSKTIEPCTALGSEHRPSPQRPITVTWTDPGIDRSAFVPEPDPTGEPAETAEGTPPQGNVW
jgi:hypothetical protein